MEHEKPFFMRDSWVYDPAKKPAPRPDTEMGFATKALHAGFHPQKNVEQFRAFVPPIVQSVTYPYPSFEKFPDYIYSRSKTPTASVLEERLAALEGGEGCVSASSGSAALYNLVSTIARPGDNVVTSLNVFGEGYKQAATIFPQRSNVAFRFIEKPEDPDCWERAIDKNTRMVWVETPLLSIQYDKSVHLEGSNP